MKCSPHLDAMNSKTSILFFRGRVLAEESDKEYLFGFETLVFPTSGILSMHNRLLTLHRERKTCNRIIWPLL